ncbi:alkaline phosphatase family protein [Komagataeibacter rhaeticus]|nr:alkaline phosphatase family protein [Komagataeibacter rhaeticus]
MACGGARRSARGLLAPALACTMLAGPLHAATPAPIDQIRNVVVIFAENRSFDNLYNGFPGADTFAGQPPARFAQRDRDGSIMRELPPYGAG